MDLSESMKLSLLKAQQQNGQNQASSSSDSANQAGVGYVTEKLYMLLQLYLQNKGFNPSVELLQCFSELKDTPVLPNAAYLQVLANRVALDSQGRLVLRDNGKIVLPYEHFANAVMLKHMSGLHGLHLSIDATVRAVMESYTIGRENFGMEKDFIVEVVQSCPSPACRYYKGHMGVGNFMEQSFSGSQINPDYLNHLQQLSASNANNEANQNSNNPIPAQVKMTKNNQVQQQQQQQQITAAIIQQQNRAIAQQSLEKFGNLSSIEKQRVLQQLDKKHYESNQVNPVNMPMVNPNAGIIPSNMINQNVATANTINTVPHNIPHNIPPVPQQQQQQQQQHQQQQINQMENNSHKMNDYLRTNIDCLESFSNSNKDLLALHNGAWTGQESRDGFLMGQEKIIRAFTELMRNMARMKTFIRPSMCKPYGKQSESLQKTLVDTIQLVQSLRNCLPAPHIPVSSWKSEDRHRKDSETV